MSTPLEVAIDHPTRKRAVRLLVGRGSMTSSEVAEHLGLPLPSTTHHLKVLVAVDVFSVAVREKRERVYTENLDECPPWVREAIEASDESGETGEVGA
jgi:DNA-binding transcriptional ArsR family regulator